MSPVLVVGPGFGPGLLTSASTRRPGIVSNTDIAPTILRFFGLDVPDAMSGHAMSSMPSRHHVTEISDLDDAIATASALRRPLIAAGIVWQSLALLLGIVALRLDRRGRPARMARAALLLGLAMPLGYLLQPTAPLTAPWAAIIVVLGWAALATWAAQRLPLAPVRVGVVCAATAVALAAAAAMNSPLLWQSALGYDFLYGGRFYGIDNDLMLMLVVSAAITSGVAADIWGVSARRWLVVVWGATVLIIGAPLAGANWGGAITAAAVGAAAYWALRPPRLGWLLGAGAMLAGLGLVLLLHLLPGVQTHVTESVRLMTEQGWGPAWAAVQRKLAANAGFVRMAPALLAPFAMLLGAGYLIARPVGRWRGLFQTYPGARAGLLAAAVGGVVGGLVNDSGALSVACAAPVLVGAFLYVGLIPESAQARTGP